MLFEADHGASLRALYHKTLRAMMFSNRPEFRPNSVNKIAADEVDALMAFLDHSDTTAAVEHGRQLCHTGLSEESLLRLGQVTRRFCLSNVAPEQHIDVLDAVDTYYNGVIRGFTAAQRVLLLEEQERIRSALQRTNIRYAVQMEVAADVARAATSILDLNELLQTAVELIRNRFELYYVAIFLVDKERRWVTLHASAGEVGQAVLRHGHRLKVGGDSLVGWCVANGEPRIALDVGDKAISFDTPLLTDIHSEMVIPLISRGKVIGAMAVQSRRVGAFAEQDIAVFRITADQLANAIENARLFRERERRIVELSTLNEMSRALSSALKLDELLMTVHQQIACIFDAANFSIAAYDDANNTWSLAYHVNQNIRQAALCRPLGNDMLSYVICTRTPVLLSNRHEQIRFFETHGVMPPDEQVKSWMGVPLIAADKVVGVMTIFSEMHDDLYSLADLGIFSTIATQAAIAIENARLYEQLREELVERQRAAETLREAKEAAEAASRAKSTFLANMSHELRTPLTGIIGYSELLQREIQSDNYTDLITDLTKIHKAGNHLLSIINDLLDLSKIEAGKMTLLIEDFDLVALLKEVGSTVLPLIAKNKNVFEISVDEKIGIVHSDLTKLRQIVLNLLSNASKFTQQGRVTLRAQRVRIDDVDYINIEVADTGIGISETQLSRLFQEFAQADPNTTRKYGGTGLGLALSRRLCKLLGGGITVESSVGKGSTFTIRVPASISDGAPVILDSKLEPARQQAAPASPITPLPVNQMPMDQMGTRFVLAIDDDPATRDLLTRSLAGNNVTVVPAVDGEEGLLVARALQPDVIILDILLPGIDGWAVLTEIKADPDIAHTPVIVLSIVDERDKCLALGASEYLTKPIDSERLTELVRSYCNNPPALPSVDRSRILVAEGDSTLRTIIRQTIEQEPVDVIEVARGEEVLAQVKNAAPDLILLNVWLPDQDGIQVVEQLRADAESATIPIIMLTADLLSPDDQQRLKHTVQHVFHNGASSRDDLLRYVKTYIGNSANSVSEESRYGNDLAS
jgi:signal transduction histidine kinase/CheY-like chemotaxis protein/putative methionine-R-sulfoxide reductase with GAF domain